MAKFSVLMAVLALVVAGCGDGGGAGGGGKAVDPVEAAKKGVAFLTTNQNENGSFGGEKFANVGITGLAVVAISTTPMLLSDEQQAVIDKAVEYIKTCVQEDGSIQNKQAGYEHYHTSLSTMALLKVDPDAHKALIDGARNYMLGSQHSEANGGYTKDKLEHGGWRYGKEDADKEADPDLSNTQFVLDALKESGLPADSDAFKRARIFLSRCQNRTENEYTGTDIGDDGSANYSPTTSKAMFIELPNGKKILRGYASMSYALLKSYIFCNVKKDDPRVQAVYKWLQDNYTLDKNVNMDQQGLYYNYLTMARALQAYGEPTIKDKDGVEHKWAEELAAKVASLQDPEDGSWTNPQDRWFEGDKALVTSYAVWTLNICNQMMKQK